MSRDHSVTFETLELRRTPGIEAGFTAGAISPGVNIVYGPNASGKTTLARAISALLWPRVGDPLLAFSGSFRLNGSVWRVAIDGGRPVCQRDGQDADLPPFSQTDLRDRYLLALHDLLVERSDSDAFAALILRESSGGYDLRAAVEQLGYSPRARGAQSLARGHADAQRRTQTARQQQDRLRAEQRRLAELDGELDRARTAVREVDAFARAIAYRDALDARQRAVAALERFPGPVTRATGAEAQRLRELREELAELDLQARQAEAGAQHARERLNAGGLGASDLPPGVVAGVAELARAVQAREADLRRLEGELSDAQAVVDAEGRRLAGVLAPEQLAALPALDAAALNAAAELARRAEDARGRLAATEQLIAWVGALTAPDSSVRQQAREGVTLLHGWLAQPTAAARGADRWWMAGMAALVVLEALVLALVAHSAWLAVGLVGVVALARTLRPAVGADPRATWRERYERLCDPTDQPARWDVPNVERALMALDARLAAVDEAARRWERWGGLASEREARMAELTALRGERDALAARGGIVASADAAALTPLFAAIERWQSADARAAGAAAWLAEGRQQHARLLARLAEQLAPLAYPPAATGEEALGQASDLAARQAAWQAALRDLAAANATLHDTLEPLRQARLGEHDALFESLGLPVGDEPALRATLDQLAAYRIAREHVGRASADLESAERATADRPELRECDRATLGLLLDEARTQAERLETIRTEASDIRARLAAAGRADDLERALADESQRLDDLRDARDLAWSASAGWALGEWLRAQTRDLDRPRVFHRARDLFARVTQGRYELDIDDREPPRFRARDAVSGAGLALGELSSGTRLQLLLAVRMAFVESQEQGPMLPLLLDETLGNSDESRARALIDAVVQFARDGRQVFYFTAQHDEVAKWRAMLATQAGVSSTVIDLAALRGYAAWERLPLGVPEVWAPPAVPEPGDLTRQAYGELLRVPEIDIRSEHLGGAHLWHFIDDPARLYRLLRLDISSWGQLETLLRHHGAGLLDEGDWRAVCEARATLYVAIVECWKAGRGRPVTATALRESGVVSDVFLPRVVRLAEELDGDGARLIEELADGRLRHFHRRARQQLLAYFEEHGYVDCEPRLTRDQARVRLLGQLAGELQAGTLSVELIHTALAQQWR